MKNNKCKLKYMVDVLQIEKLNDVYEYFNEKYSENA